MRCGSTAGGKCENATGAPGETLSPETAAECLTLLAEAAEAYEGQGFGQQAENATRYS